MVSQKSSLDGGWGWMVVFAAFAVNIIIDGCSYSFGVLLPSLVDYFKESRSKTAWIGSVLNASPLLCGPIASIISKRLGYRKATVIGGLITAVGLISSAFVTSLNAMIVTYGLIAGFGISLPYLNSIVVVASYFEKKRTLANGIAECGAGIGTLLISPLYEYLISAYNWRIAVGIIGGISLGIVVCGLVFRPRIPAESNTARNENSDSGIDISVNGVELTEQRESRSNSKDNCKPCLKMHLLRNRSFIMLISSTIILYFWYDVPYIFTVDRAKQYGITETKAAFIISITGITHTVGNLLFGFLGDRKKINRKCLYGISLLFAGIVLGLVPFCTDYVSISVLSGLYGLLSASPEALTSVLIVDILGIESLNDAFGIVMFLQGAANLVGPPVAGWLYDVSGRYDNTFHFAGIFIAVSGIIMLLLQFKAVCHQFLHSSRYSFNANRTLSDCCIRKLTVIRKESGQREDEIINATDVNGVNGYEFECTYF